MKLYWWLDMYAGIDIGGTKTLAARLGDNGVIGQMIRFETPKKYDVFLRELRKAVKRLGDHDYHAAGVGLPAAHLDRDRGVGIDFGNLPWKNAHIQHDIERILHCPVVIENDAKMAALSEAMLVKETYNKVLYITISTGIGIALVENREIETSIGDGGGRTMMVEHHNQLQPWEDFASGRAIVERFGKMAKDINDKATWQIIARDLSRGFIELIALTQPEVIVIGGSVGTHFKKYEKLLVAELKKYETPLLTIPTIKQAGRPEEAVVFGCYDLAKATYGLPPKNGVH